MYKWYLYNLEDKCEWCPAVKGYCAYILKCIDDTYYGGYTSRFKYRMIEHFNKRGCPYTKKHTPVFILHYEVLPTKKEALSRERFFQRNIGWIKENESNFNRLPLPSEPPQFDAPVGGIIPVSLDDLRKVFHTVMVITANEQ